MLQRELAFAADQPNYAAPLRYSLISGATGSERRLLAGVRNEL